MQTSRLSILSRHGLPVLLGLSALAWTGCGSSTEDLFDPSTTGGSAGTSGQAQAGAAGSAVQGGAAGKGGSAQAGAAQGGAAGKGGAIAGQGGKGGAQGGQAGKGGTGPGGGGPGGSGPGGSGPGGAGGKGNAGEMGQGGQPMAGAPQGGSGGQAEAGSTGMGGEPQGGATQGGAGSGGEPQGGAGQNQGGAGAEQGGAGQGGEPQGGAGQGGAGQNQGGAGVGGDAQGGAGQGGAGQNQGGAGTSQGGAGQAQGGAGTNQGGAGAGGGTVEPADSCPGAAIQIGSGTSTFTGSTSGLQNDNKSGTQCGGSNSSDAVYQVTATASGALSITLDASFHPALYLRLACGDQGSLITCNGNGNGTSTDLTDLQVTAGATFWVFVDGNGGDNQAGDYTLSLTITPPECGNGTREPGEQCDDGGTDPGDGCSPTCAFEPKCIAPEVAGDTFNNPQKPPADSCHTADFAPATLSSNNDNDWYCVQAKAGDTIVAETYVGQPGACDGSDTILELFQGKPGQIPGNTSCNGSNALQCDDNSGPGNCSLIEQQVDKDGLYCLRVSGRVPFNQSSPYGLSVTVF
jgi:cysteine-rich repeat protein